MSNNIGFVKESEIINDAPEKVNSTGNQSNALLVNLKTEVLEIKEMLQDDYVKKSEIKNTFMPMDYVNVFEKKSHAADTYQKKGEYDDSIKTLTDSIDKKIDKSELLAYAKKSDFDAFKRTVNNNFDIIKNKTLPSLDGFLKSSDAENLYVQKGELDNILDKYTTTDKVNGILKDKLLSYVTYSVLEKYAKLKDIKGFVKKEDINGFVKKEDIPDINGFVTENDVIKLISNKLNDLSFDQSILEPYVKKTSLSYYVTRDILTAYVKSRDLDDFVRRVELGKFITMEDLRNNMPSTDSFVDKSDLDVLISDIYKYIDDNKYVPEDTSIFLKKENIDDILNDYVTKKNLSIYMKESDVMNIISNYVPSKSVYATKNYLKSEIDKLYSYVDSKECTSGENSVSNTSYILGLLGNYVTKDSIKDFVNVSEVESIVSKYIDNNSLDFEIPANLVTKDKMNETLKYYARNTDISSFVTASDVLPLVSDYINDKISEIVFDDSALITRDEVERCFLRINDYRNIKNASVFNTEYSNNQDGFLNADLTKFMNGLYVVEDKVIVVNNGKAYINSGNAWIIEE